MVTRKVTYLDLLFLKLDLDVFIVDFAVLADVLLQLLEHALHILRWTEAKNTGLELIEGNQNGNSFLLSLILVHCGARTFLIMFFQLFLNQGTNCGLSSINLILLLLFLVLKTVALKHEIDLPVRLLEDLSQPVH